MTKQAVCIVTTALHRGRLWYMQLREMFRSLQHDAETKNTWRRSSAPTYMLRYVSTLSETFTFHTSTICKEHKIIFIWFHKDIQTYTALASKIHT
jgi:hypothetical protein